MSQHVVAPKVYYAVFGALLVATAVTVAIASFDLGRLNAVIALTIAVAKALLVILYFMHARYSPRLTWLVISGGFVWLALMIALTMGDVLTRDLLGFPGT